MTPQELFCYRQISFTKIQTVGSGMIKWHSRALPPASVTHPMILMKTIPKVELQTNIKMHLVLCRTLPGLLLGFFGFDVTETKRSRNGISLPRKRTWDRDTSSLVQLLALPQGWFSFKIKFKNSLKIQFKLQTLNLNL